MKNEYLGWVKYMTLDEKASLCSGKDFWHTKPVVRFDIPGIMVADGPHGVRKQISKSNGSGIGESQKSTCFPAACTTACSFDRKLLFEIGQALAEECLDQEVSVLLGPGANIKRSPLCGRNFEYVSEDPYLTGDLAQKMIEGIQSRGIGTSLKHFAANNQEKARMVCDSIIDERALREIYLSGFEKAVKSASPWTVMCSYNILNGTYTSENHRLLTTILRDEWGFDGVVMSDWGAVNDRPKGLAAGLELEMPPSGRINDQRIVEAVLNKTLPEAVLDTAVMRILDLVHKFQKPPEELKDPGTYQNKRCGDRQNPYKKNNELAARAARESAVLLKNDGLLPSDKSQNIAVVGRLFKEARYQGSGSSKINPTQMSSPYDAFTHNKLAFAYADGYRLDSNENDRLLLDKAIEAARGKDIVFVFAGLPDEYESEGFDRSHMDLPPNQNQLIMELAKINPNIAVVLFAGSPFLMPWLSAVKSVLLCYLPGQAAGDAVYDLLFGIAVPCGKLAETFPLCLSDNPSYPYFGGSKSAEYRESIFVGYRYYDTANKNVLFPFGFGLSYSTFSYIDLSLSETDILDSDTITVRALIRNTGSYDASEIVQIYVQPPPSTIFKAKKELKGFGKIALKRGETGAVTVTLDKRSFAYYNTNINDWHVETGVYHILAGASSADIRLTASLYVQSTAGEVLVPDFRQFAPAYYSFAGNNLVIPRQQFELIYGAALPADILTGKGHYHFNSTLSELNSSFAGRIFVKNIHKRYLEAYEEDSRPDQIRMMNAMFEDIPLRGLVNFSNGELGYSMLESLLMLFNGHPLKGLLSFLKNSKRNNH